MSISQIVRGSKSQANPTGIVKDIVNLNRKFSGTGSPSFIPGAVVGNTYIDTASGLEYALESDGGWTPIVDYTTLPPPAIPDPLNIGTLQANEVDTDLIRGKASDDILIDGATGIVQVKTSGAGKLQIGQTGALDAVVIRNNGNVEAGSLVRGNALSALGTTNEARIEEVGGIMELHNNGGDLNIQTDTAAADVNIKTGRYMQVQNQAGTNIVKISEDVSPRLQVVDGANNVEVSGFGSVFKNGVSPLILKHENTNSDIECVTKGTGKLGVSTSGGKRIDVDPNLNEVNATDAGNFKVSGGVLDLESRAGDMSLDATSGKVNITSDSSASGGTVVDGFSLKFQNSAVHAGGEKIEIASGGIFFRTPSGQVSLINQVAGDFVIAPQVGSETSFSNTGIKDILSINNSSAIVQNSVLNVSNTGVLSYRAYPQSIDMILSGFGGNTGGTGDYFNLGTANLSPAEVWGVCSGNGRSLSEFSLRLHSNAAFNFGGGTAQCDIGYIANNAPMTEANFTVLRTHNFNTAADFYGITLSGYNDAIPFRAAVCARMVLAGTSSTITNAELSLNIVLV